MMSELVQLGRVRQAWDPGIAIWSLLHLWQVSTDCCPTADENVPHGQSVHSVLLRPSLYVPLGHLAQVAPDPSALGSASPPAQLPAAPAAAAPPSTMCFSDALSSPLSMP